MIRAQVELPSPCYEGPRIGGNNAWIGRPADSWWLYAAGYKKAADILVDHIALQQRDQDTLVYPILFLYRQHIELRLKHLAKDACSLLEEEFQLTVTHNLDPLWRSLRKHVSAIEAKFGAMGDQAVLDEAERILLALGAIDPKGKTFRYPESIKGESHRPNVPHINVQHFRDEIEKLTELLEGIDTHLGVLRDMRSDWLSSLY